MERLQKLVIPVSGVNVEKHRARGVGFIGHVNLAVCQFPDEPGVNRSKGEFAPFRLFASPGNILQQPPNLGTRKVRVDYQARLALDEFFQTLGSHLITDRCGPTVLPNDRVEDWFTCFSIPNQGGLTLVSDADGRDVLQIEIRAADCVSNDFDLRRPDLVWVVFNPSGLWEK